MTQPFQQDRQSTANAFLVINDQYTHGFFRMRRHDPSLTGSGTIASTFATNRNPAAKNDRSLSVVVALVFGKLFNFLEVK